MPDASKLNFFTPENMDKVAASDTFTYTMAAGVNDGSGFVTPVEATQILTNPYGRKGFLTIAYSIDNINFYPGKVIWFQPGALPTPNDVRASVGGSVNDENIYFYFTHYIDTPVTFYVRWALDTIT